ncbi:hypothetical protein RhiirA5_501274 [Rhizophagus irregularis]|uniref:Uncharacterized protein n=2 Tax=Rhizophagus irregularis TaxID=588596 RepID=A0A2N0PIE6_9GLOM|nr:hypothetical protein RhiirA5_501274 [Rhizophagus irregularis]UZO17287.1 hypothetical protein OCT59_008646 [Rhizophagus irregularis]GET61198.1 hypothetical protein GLOIN_2v1884264 [Rhizophagus irregularis DAOM 181602=DAOM 197198]CAB5186413.1 unnamed protein product [Rhizophagus irregularis]
MKLIIFIIVLFLTFFKTFAFKSFDNCYDHGSIFESVRFIVEGLVELKLVQPDKTQVPCCLQQGVMIIKDYMIYKDDGSKDPLFTFVGDRTWVNGYDRSNILHKIYCNNNSFNCDSLYEGDYEYTRLDSYDTSKLTRGDEIIVSLTTYSHCYYSSETICLGSCNPVFHIPYFPPINSSLSD